MISCLKISLCKGKVHLISQAGEMKILRKGLRKFLDTRREGSPYIIGLPMVELALKIQTYSGVSLVRLVTAKPQNQNKQ